MKKTILFIFLSFFILELSAQMQLKKMGVYKNYLKTSYELSNYDYWLSSDDIYYKGEKYYEHNPFTEQPWCQIDINGDGLEDIILYDGYSIDEVITSFVNKVPSIFMNNGSSIEKIDWTGPPIIDPMASKILIGDFNNDSFPDLFSCVAYDVPSYFDGTNQISHLLLNSKEGFKTVKEFPHQPGYHHTGCSGDIDNDGDLDVILFNSALNENLVTNKILWNDGKANFTFAEGGFSKIANVHQAELFDVNNDGFLDLVMTLPSISQNQTFDTIIMWGNGKDFNLNNSSSFEFPSYLNTVDIDFTDINNDGIAEIILSGSIEKDPNKTPICYIEIYQSDDKGKTFINKSNQYFDVTYFPRFGHMSVKDLDKNGRTDIYTGDSKDSTRWEWNGLKFINKFPKPDAPILKDYELKNNINVNLTLERVNPDLTKNTRITKWAIYCSDKEWNDSSLVSRVYVSAKKTNYGAGLDQYMIDATNKEMYIRIAAIDTFGVKSQMSNLLKISILQPTITSASICQENSLTITGSNFFGITGLKIGNYPISSYSILSRNTIRAELSTGQTGNISLLTITGTLTYSNLVTVTPPSEVLTVKGNRRPFTGTIETYSVNEVTGVQYDWVFPQGWEQISGGNTNIVKVKIGKAEGTIKVIPSAFCGNLTTLSFPVSVYTYIPDDNFQKVLRELKIDKENKSDSVLTSSLTAVSSLDIDSKEISDLTGIQDFELLKILNCQNNKLNEIDLSGNRLLEKLNCENNKIAKLDLTNNTLMEYIYSNNNQISSVDISHCPHLISILCGGNKILEINVLNNKELAFLVIGGNYLTSLDLNKNTELRFLSCNNNQMGNIDVSRNLKLGELYCQDNKISNLDLSSNKSLVNLICSNNQLISLNIKNGVNSLISRMWANGNPNLTCIRVDNPTLAASYSDWKKDAIAMYSDYCIPTGIEPVEIIKSIVVKPNPSTGIFKIEGLQADSETSILVYTIDGKFIKKQMSNSVTETVDLSSQISGLYVLFVNGQAFKLIKE